MLQSPDRKPDASATGHACHRAPLIRDTGLSHKAAMREAHMMMIYLNPLLALVSGLLILIFPRLLSTIVAIYLILTGLAGLLGTQL